MKLIYSRSLTSDSQVEQHSHKKTVQSNRYPEDMVQTFTHEEPTSYETLGSHLFCTRRCAKLGLWSDPKSEFEKEKQWPLLGGSMIGLWSDQQSESPGTESPDPDPQESQICLLGNSYRLKLIILS